MSATIDQRVVEMRFDNKHFESNVSQTMSTLDKLKSKLNLSGASKGLEGINTAAKNVDMRGLGSAVDTVTARFSALQVMGVTALANITNSAVNAGKQIVKSLTIDPIKTGFQEYETKMGSIQTILANTQHEGTNLDQVTAALEELNLYADKTIYNFQEMTRNIGTFTAAGVSLDTSVRSIQGIANLAAISGSTSQQASTAMYQLSQALSAGTVKLMDWNSVVNAGMGGKVFQDALKRTAKVMGTNVDALIEKYGSFRETLSAGWITSDVLTKTLEQFTMAAEEGSEQWEKFKKSLMDDGYTEKQAEEILKMANTATDAATKVKTFTQLMDTLKESAQSGWGQTWELLVGNFEEAKAFFTELSDLFGGIIGESADRRNSFLTEALGSNWDKLIGKINEAGVKTEAFEDSIRKVVGDNKLDSLITKYGSIKKAAEEGAISSDLLKKALDGISTTDAGSKIANFVEGIKEIDRVLRKGDRGEDVKKLQTALDELGYDLGAPGIDGIIGPITEKAIKAFQEANDIVEDGIVGPKTLAALEKAGTKVEEVTGNVEGLTESCGSLIDVITKTSGRELLLDSLMNVIKAIRKPLGQVTTAMRETFSIKPVQLYQAIEALNKFTSSLIMSDETADKVGRTFKGLFAVFDLLVTAISGPLKIGLELVGAVLSKFGLSLLDITAALGDVLVSFRDKVDESIGAVTSIIADKVGSWITTFKEVEIFQKTADLVVGAIDKISEIISSVTSVIGDNIGKWVEKVKEIEIFKTCAEWFSETVKTISDSIDDISKRIEEFKVSTIVERLKTFNDFLSDIANSISNSKIFITIVDAICGAFTKLKEFFSRFKLPEFNIDNLTKFTKMFTNVEESGLSGFSGLVTGIKNYFTALASTKWDTFKKNALEKFVTFWINTGDKIKSAFEVCKKVATSIKEFIFGTEDVNLPTILGVAEKFLGIVLILQALKTLSAVISPFDNVTDALNNLASGFKWDAISSAFKSMALALGVLTVCIITINSMGDIKGAIEAASLLAGLMAVMGAVVTAVAFAASKIQGGVNAAGAAASLLMIVASLMLLVETLKKIDETELKHPVKTFVNLGLVLLALSAGISMISKAAGSSFKSVAAILTLVAALKLILEVVDTYDEFDWSGKTRAIERMAQMMFILAAAINLSSRGIKASGSSVGLALTLIAMVASLKLLIGIMEEFAAMPTETLVKGGLVVVTILGVMTTMMAVLNATSNGLILERGQRAVNQFAGLAIALLAVIAAIWALGKMDFETLKQGGIAVAGILTMFTVMLAAVGKSCSGLKIGSIMAMMVAIGVLMAEMAIIIHTMKSIPWEQSVGSAGALVALMLAMAAVLRVLTKHNIKAANIFKWIGAMAAFAVVLVELALVLNLMKDVNPVNSIGNVIAMTALMLAMAAVLTTLAKHRNNAKSIYKWIGAMGAFAIVMGELALVLNLVKDVNPTNAIGNVIALDILLAGMAACLITLTKYRVGAKSIYKWVGAMAAFGIVMAELAFVLNLVNNVNPANAIGSVLAIDILLAGMSMCLTSLTKHRNGATTIYKWIGAMAAFAVVLVELAAILHLIDGLDPLNSIGNVIALSTLLLALTASLAIMSACKVKANYGAIAAVALLGLVAAELVGVIHLMKGIDPSNAIPNVLALSTLVTVLSLVLIPLAAVGTMGVSALFGVGVLATLATSLFILVGVLAAMPSIANASTNAQTLAGLLTVLTLVLIPLTVIGAFGVVGLAGVGVLATLMASLFIIVGVLASMQNIQNAQNNADILIDLLTTMTDALVQISLLAPLAVLGVGALASLITLIGRLGVMVVAVGKLMDYAPSIETFIDNGIELFKKLASGLGEMISAFAVGLTSGFADVGANLSMFMVGALPFITLVKSVDESVSTGAGHLVSALLKLVAADFVAGIADLCGLSLVDLAYELSGFAENIGGFISAIGDIDTSAITGVETLCSAINALTGANLKDSITQLLPGDNSLSTFGANIKDFAVCLKDAASSLSNITDEDVENIKRSAAAGEALAELNRAIPSQGGWVQDIVGSKELITFGESIEAFADCLVNYSAKVSGKNIDSAAITNSAAAATALSDLNNAIPAQGGWAQEIMGAQELSAFGNSIVAFAGALVDYSATVSGQSIDVEAIKNSAAAAEALATLNGKLPSQNGLWQAVAGEQDLGDFGTKLVSFAAGVVAYATAAATIDESKITAITNSGKAIDELVLVMDKIPETGGWGDEIFGSSDGQSFGAALVAIATGIAEYCAVAATVGDDDITAIQKSKTALDELGTILSSAPETDTSQKASFLANAVADLIGIASSINQLTTSEYDYSGLSTLKTQISTISDMLIGVDAADVQTKFGLLKSAIKAAASCAEKLSELSGRSYEGIGRFKDAIIELSGVDIDAVISAIDGRANDMTNAMKALVDAMTSGINNGSSGVVAAMRALIDEVKTSVEARISSLEEAGVTLVSNLVKGIESEEANAVIAGENLGTEAASGASAQSGAMTDAGVDLGNGLVAGIESMVDAAYWAGYALGQAAVQGERDGQASASPSKETIKAGKWLGEGLVIGIQRISRSVYNAGSAMGKEAVSSISNSVSRIADVISTDIDSQPTIRPVVDLSDVRTGAKTITELLGFGSDIGVLANVNGINTMMNRRSQNGANTEVVSAIDKLRKDIGNIQGNSYSIGGVSYDDGSAVGNAVLDLVRALRVEGRI